MMLQTVTMVNAVVDHAPHLEYQVCVHFKGVKHNIAVHFRLGQLLRLAVEDLMKLHLMQGCK